MSAAPPLGPVYATIDFEASGYFGHPIDVGIALWRRGEGRIETWSSLIRVS